MDTLYSRLRFSFLSASANLNLRSLNVRCAVNLERIQFSRVCIQERERERGGGEGGHLDSSAGSGRVGSES